MLTRPANTANTGKSFSWLIFVCIILMATFAESNSLPECVTDSTEGPLTLISSAPCGTFGVITTRKKEVDGVELEVKVRFMVHAPDNPKAVVVLLAGGIGNTGIAGNEVTGEVTEAGNNFLVRSAQLFAERGFKAITINRPLLAVPGPPPELVPEFDTTPDFDRYRVSPKHKQDIMRILSEVNSKGLHVFLVGTSRGAMSAVAQDKLGEGIALSSPVTSVGGNPDTLYIGHPDFHSLQVKSVKVPVHVLRHTQDGCFVSTPANSAALHSAFVNAGVASTLDSLSGGFDLTGQNIDGVVVDACDALTHHGFLGIENAAVGKIADWLDGILDALKH